MGDENRNGRIDLEDARQLLKMSLKLIPSDAERVFYLDFDENNKIDLSDAQTVLRQALKIEESCYYRPLACEQIYESVEETGLEGFYVFENQQEAWELLLSYEMNDATEQVAKIPAEQWQDKKLCLAARKIYGESLMDVTTESVYIKEGVGTVYCNLTDNAGLVQDSKKKTYAVMYLVDKETEAQSMKDTSNVISEIQLVKQDELFGIEDGIFYSYEEFVEALEMSEEEKQALVAKVQVDELFFETNTLVVKNIRTWDNDNLSVKVESDEGKLLLKLQGSVYDVMEERTGSMQKDMTCYIRLPKEYTDGKTVEVQYQTDTMHGYKKEEHVQVLPLNSQEEALGNAKIYLPFYVEEEKQGHFQEDYYFWSRIRSLNLSEENEKRLLEQLATFDFENYDVLIAKFSPMYFDDTETFSTVTCNFMTQRYGGKLSLAICYGEGTTIQVPESREMLCMIPVKKTSVTPMDYPLALSMFHITTDSIECVEYR